MRKVDVSLIKEAVAQMSIDSNIFLSDAYRSVVNDAVEKENNTTAKALFSDMCQNLDMAVENKLPVCQDTGMAVVFITYGQDVLFTGGSLTGAVNDGVEKGYREGYLRKSVVADPLYERKNSGNNLPAVIHLEMVEGDKVVVDFMPKGFGSENMSAVRMLKPTAGEAAVVDFVTETVRNAGANPCPPLFIGVGIGGTFEKAALLSKKALLRDAGTVNEKDYLASLESKILASANKLDIGPQGLGGDHTVLGVSILDYPTHIAGLPVAVNICCHVHRHKQYVI